MALPKTATFMDELVVPVSLDDFSVDELLDFSNDQDFSDQPYETHVDQPDSYNNNNNKPPSTSSVISSLTVTPPPSALSLTDAFAPQPELVEEGLESLEWLSHFVEDSEYSLTGKLPPNNPVINVNVVNHNEPYYPYKKPRFSTPVQTKARTKRARTGVRVWPVSFTESSSTSSTSSTETAAPLRRCSHCGVTKTPQWRAGPHGSKTLCNACGVRFKSGRLLPEYRPACSPTFVSELHSNNHRKVMEMRRKKEGEPEDAGSGSGFLMSY